MNKLEVHGLSVLIFTWIFGLSVIEYPIGRQRPVISFLYITFIIGIFGYAVKNIINHADLNIADSTLSDQVALLLFFVSIAFSHYVLGLVWLFRKEESECLRRLTEVTESIRSISSDSGLKNMKRNKIIQIIFCVLIVHEVIVFSASNTLGLESISRFQNLCCIIYERIIMLYINLIFVNYLRIIQLNFAKLNKKLKELTAFTDCSSSMSVYELIKNISRIKQLHIRLTRVSTSFNDLYGICALLSLTLKFASTMYHMYRAYCHFYNVTVDPTILVYSFIRNCQWISFHVYVIVILNDACRFTAMEANKTGCRIFELSNSGSSMEVDDEIERFSMQLLQNPLEITAHGFFVLNRGITFDVIMALISYLIVLVQLSMSEV